MGMVGLRSENPIVFKEIQNSAFCLGEKLTFVIKYEFIKAGFATMTVTEGPQIQGRSTIHLESRAESTGFVDSFFKVRDFNASTADEKSLISFNFHQNLKEGHYKVIRNTSFDYDKLIYKFNRVRKGKLVEREGPISQPLFDMLSAFFYVRTLPLKLGSRYEVTVFSDEEVYPLAVNVLPSLQKVNVQAGKFECLRIEPVFLGDGIFKAKDGKMTIWLTNDEKKMPVLIRSKVFIGSFDAELTDFSFGK
ncbi:MAG: hypothetical protein KCHDKBKB_00159 [Elusimicrobia bacterium]|nr:hypothetical protein [Elusimicrobiota bacterium]